MKNPTLREQMAYSTIARLETELAKAKAGGWIRCSDRLPTAEDRTVAVLLDGEDPCVAWASYWSGASTAFAHWTFPLDELGEGRQVTHWCPLPATPTE